MVYRDEARGTRYKETADPSTRAEAVGRDDKVNARQRLRHRRATS